MTERGSFSNSTFMVEHDAGLTPYEAFLLHERTRAAADATSPCPRANRVRRAMHARRPARAR